VTAHAWREPPAAIAQCPGGYEAADERTRVLGGGCWLTHFRPDGQLTCTARQEASAGSNPTASGAAAQLPTRRRRAGQRLKKTWLSLVEACAYM
jgi:hypothetical protein